MKEERGGVESCLGRRVQRREGMMIDGSTFGLELSWGTTKYGGEKRLGGKGKRWT